MLALIAGALGSGAVAILAAMGGASGSDSGPGRESTGYVVVRHVLLAGPPISRPESEEAGAVTAQYVVNKHRWAAASMPITVAYNANGAPAGIDAGPMLEDAAVQWSAVSPATFSFQWAGDSTGAAGSCGTAVQRDGVNTVTFVDDLPSGWLGQTCTVWSVSAGANAPLVEFDMELSSTVQWSTAETTPGNRYDLRSTILHEMGHAAGLGHTSDGSAVMYASLKAGTQKRSLTADDRDGLLAAYPGTAPTPSPATPTPTAVPPVISRDYAIVTANLARD